MNVKIKLLNENAVIPTRGSEYAAGYDVAAALNPNEPMELAPHSITKVPTGLAFEIPEGYFLAIQSRSGLATKKGLRVSQGTGILDADYRGELYVPLTNDSEYWYTLEPGTRIAQIILQKFDIMDFQVVDELETTERGEGGFGSTGTN